MLTIALYLFVGALAFDAVARGWLAYEQRRLRRALSSHIVREMQAVAVATCLAEHQRVLASIRAGVAVPRKDVQC